MYKHIEREREESEKESVCVCVREREKERERERGRKARERKTERDLLGAAPTKELRMRAQEFSVSSTYISG